MKLKRKYARLFIVLLTVDVALCLLLIILSYSEVPRQLLAGILCVMAALSILIPYLRLRLLLCPNCERSAARPYWNPGEGHAQFCPKCGKPFLYDDEPDAPGEP